jgi:cytochrome c556
MQKLTNYERKKCIYIMDVNEIRNILYEKGKRQFKKLRLKIGKCKDAEQHEQQIVMFKSSKDRGRSRAIDVHVERMGKLMNAKEILVRNLKYKQSFEEICALLGHYAASCGNCLQTFRDNVSVPSSRVKRPRRKESQHCDVDSICEGARGVVISKRGDNQ